MNVFIVGGTGLLGSAGAQELLNRGHNVTSLALPPIPKNAPITKKMKLILKNYINMKDEEISELMKGCQGFVFADKIKERVKGKAPIYSMFYKSNAEPLKRILILAKRVGIRYVVILGSYFAYFDRAWKELHLYDIHPYIQSRIDQANMEYGIVFWR